MARRNASTMFATLAEHDTHAAWQRAEETRFEARIIDRLTRPTRFFACFGALIIGVGLPSFLIGWHTSFHIKLSESLLALIPFQPPRDAGALWNLFSFEFLAAAMCGPIATFAAFLNYRKLSEMNAHTDINFLVAEGALLGGCLALLNFPAYAAMRFIDWRVPLAPLLFILLLVVSGVSSGMWIAWQVYREKHGGSWFPRYGLGTLVAAVLLWGFLLTCYAP